jgi:serine/threonine-protein kinase
VFRGCLTLLIGFALGAGLVLWWWPHQPTGVALPASADVRVFISDSYLSRAVQQRVAGMTLPEIHNVRVLSSPPAALLVNADLTVGPFTAPSSMEVQPVASGGGVQVQIVESHIAGIPIPSQLTGFLQDAINGETQHALSTHSRVTGVAVRPDGVEILADYAGYCARLRICPDMRDDGGSRTESVMEIDGGRYRAIRRLGTGGTGVVYQAVDQVLGRTVAIKALRETITLDLLRREGQSLARLNHPNVVALYDLVEEGGRTYLVMEYVEGCSLDEWLANQGPLGVDAAIAIVRQIASAIAQAHDRGLLHCDLKPANVLISTTGEVKLTDFTLGQIETAGRFDGMRGGSADYAAPEQVRDEAVDRRTDVYGLGALLRRMVGPIDRSSEEGRAVAEAIARATADDPAERYPSVEALLAALPPAERGATRVSAPRTVSELTRVQPRVAKQTRGRSRIPWRLALIPAAAILAVAALITHFNVSASPAPITLPAFVGTESASAQLIARSYAFHLTLVPRYASIPAGMVISQRPAPGSAVTKGAVVTLWVSEGPRPIEIPDLSGLNQDDAVARLQQLGFRVAITTQDTIWQGAGEVLGQSPDAQSLRVPGTVVTLTISTHPWWWIF